MEIGRRHEQWVSRADVVACCERRGTRGDRVAAANGARAPQEVVSRLAGARSLADAPDVPCERDAGVDRVVEHVALRSGLAGAAVGVGEEQAHGRDAHAAVGVRGVVVGDDPTSSAVDRVGTPGAPARDDLEVIVEDEHVVDPLMVAGGLRSDVPGPSRAAVRVVPFADTVAGVSVVLRRHVDVVERANRQRLFRGGGGGKRASCDVDVASELDADDVPARPGLVRPPVGVEQRQPSGCAIEPVVVPRARVEVAVCDADVVADVDTEP